MISLTANNNDVIGNHRDNHKLIDFSSNQPKQPTSSSSQPKSLPAEVPNDDMVPDYEEDDVKVYDG